jgi:uncharacterized coiled-coil DUF342 family protein
MDIENLKKDRDKLNQQLSNLTNKLTKTNEEKEQLNTAYRDSEGKLKFRTSQVSVL